MTSPIRHIIIVDDHDAIRRGVRQLLENEPYFEVVGEAADGRTALELARKVKPDIAILDYSIPEMNGLDLSHALKRELPRIEILLYTMHDREEIVLDVLQAGVRGFVLKEAPMDDLLRAVQSVASGGTYVDPVLAGTLAASSIGNKLPELTQRERDVLRLLADGLANEEIGKRLFISAETVRTHVRKAMDKLDADTRTQAVARALRDHLIA